MAGLLLPPRHISPETTDDCRVCGGLSFRPSRERSHHSMQDALDPIPMDRLLVYSIGEQGGLGYLDMVQRDIDMKEMIKSSEKGCIACGLLRDIVRSWFDRNYMPEGRRFSEVRSLVLKKSGVGRPLVLWVEFHHPEETKYLELYIPEGKSIPGPLSLIPHGRAVSEDSSNASILHLARQWLEACTTREQHPECKPVLNMFLPTRLIDVGSLSKEPCLLETTNQRGAYATLSHCWGNMTTDPHYRTTTSATAEEKKQAIPLSKLPRTFQDAITVCRTLSIPYLWIDSLCIIQDSKEDWEREAGRMADIYKNSLVTLSADGAIDGTGGLFVGGRQRHIMEVKVACQITMGCEPIVREVIVHARQHGVIGNSYESAHCESARGRCRLNTRGWVLQEQLLPTRILHFTSAELVWECRTELRCECRLEPRSTNRSSSRVDLLPACRFDRPSEFVQSWCRIVEEFTIRRLTYESDRLPALSGLAAENAAQNPGKHYAAGLWREHLSTLLSWRTEDWDGLSERYSCRRQEEYQAPSWSWASVTGMIKYPGTITKHDAEAEFHPLLADNLTVDTVVSSTNNVFGSVSEGYLDVDALVVPIKLLKTGGSGIPLVISERNISFSPREGSAIPRFEPQADGKSPLRNLDLKLVDVSQDEDDEEPTHFLSYGPPKQFCIVDKDTNFPEGKCHRVKMFSERPYGLFDGDVKDGSFEIDFALQYILLPVGYTLERRHHEDNRTAFDAIILQQAGGSIGTWRRIGKLHSSQCVYFSWKCWLDIASPYRFRWV